jgi:hypothetical protein
VNKTPQGSRRGRGGGARGNLRGGRTRGRGPRICVGYFYPILSKFIDPRFMSVRVSSKASKTIDPPGKLEGNTTHIMRCVVSLEIDLLGGCNTQVFIA